MIRCFDFSSASTRRGFFVKLMEERWRRFCFWQMVNVRLQPITSKHMPLLWNAGPFSAILGHHPWKTNRLHAANVFLSAAATLLKLIADRCWPCLIETKVWEKSCLLSCLSVVSARSPRDSWCSCHVMAWLLRRSALILSGVALSWAVCRLSGFVRSAGRAFP